MATVGIASPQSRQKITPQHLEELAGSIGLSIPDEHVEQWRELVAATQDSLDIVEALPNYVPEVDLDRFPRKRVHRPLRSENPGNAWAWKVSIEGAKDGLLSGLTFCLKDNIAVKDVPMLIGTEVVTDFIPDVDASGS